MGKQLEGKVVVVTGASRGIGRAISVALGGEGASVVLAARAGAKLEEVADSLAIGQSWAGDQRIILFVRLNQGYRLDDGLKNRIKKTLRDNASPRHVPAKIIAVPDIPYTLNMKKVESAVTNIINGRPVMNRDALTNPESLDYYQELEELKS